MAPPAETEADIDWINDAAKPMFVAMAPRRAAELAVDNARVTDRLVETLSDDILARNAAAGAPLSLDRAEHRREHLDEIAAVLGRR